MKPKQQQIMEFTKTITLPFSGKSVVLTMPNYGIRKKIKAEYDTLVKNKVPGYGDDEIEEFGLLLISKISAFDGEMIVADDLQNLPLKDIAFLMSEWNEWDNSDEIKK